jgi:Predicted restriction endonuclease
MPSYNQINASGDIVPGSNPTALTPQKLRSIIYEALNDKDYTFKWLHQKSQPYQALFITGEKEVNAYIYVWNITPAYRANPSEKRIQISDGTNNIGFSRDITDIEKTVLLGIYNYSLQPIFAAWDAEAYRSHGQNSCYVSIEELKAALSEGIHKCEPHGSAVYTFTADYFGNYLALLQRNNKLDFQGVAAQATLKERVRKADLSDRKKRAIKSMDQLRASARELNETEKDAVFKRRIGQGIFKDLLRNKFQCKCALCDITTDRMLIGSHIQEWKESSDFEKLDENNGLLLCAHHDALFDKHLISFNDDGSLIVSPILTSSEKEELQLNSIINFEMNDQMKAYMARHRSKLRQND